MKLINGMKVAKEIANNKGGECLSSSYINIMSHMIWRCSDGHTWKATLNQVKNQGHWCPHCAKNTLLTYNYIKSEVENRNGTLLSTKYTNIFEKLKIKCYCENIFYMSFNSIKYGRWCPECGKIKKANKRRHSYDYIKKQIYNKRGQLLTEEYRNRSQKLTIKCNYGHIFDITFRNIYNGHWCSGCAINKSQKKLQNIVEKIFKTKVIPNYKGFDWLKNPQTNNRLEIDIWLPDLKIAIEYDGIQHFKPTRFGGITQKSANRKFIYQKKLDLIKDELIKKHKDDVIFFVRIPYTEKLEPTNIKNILSHNNKIKESLCL